MRHSEFHINDNNCDVVSYFAFANTSTNANDIVIMKKILLKAMKLELTDRQRECLSRYYFDNQKMCDIAQQLSISPSTVTRHISAAKEKLRNVARYY